MPGHVKEAPLDYLGLGEFLEAVAYPVRLALLDALRFPHTLKEIKLTPHRIHAGANPERNVARQTIQAHLSKLVEQGLVHVEQVEKDGKSTTFYVTNPGRLYAMTEELRRLSLRYAGRGTGTDHTGTVSASVEPQEATGPRLVLVHGVYEGKGFGLDDSTARDGVWTIGRAKGLPITLDYDPFVSSRNAQIERRQGRFVITDLKESKNGTWVNWTRLAAGGSRTLKAGDVIGVGKSLLSFVPE